ncbi:hypothetical protein VPH35_089243 [Triticum aestivum]
MLRGSLWRLLAVAVAVSAATGAVAALKAGRSLHRDFDDGWVVELALDRETGSRLESKDRYLFGRFDLDIRLVAGMSAGTRDHRFLQPSSDEGGGSAQPWPWHLPWESRAAPSWGWMTRGLPGGRRWVEEAEMQHILFLSSLLTTRPEGDAFSSLPFWLHVSSFFQSHALLSSCPSSSCSSYVFFNFFCAILLHGACTSMDLEVACSFFLVHVLCVAFRRLKIERRCDDTVF